MEKPQRSQKGLNPYVVIALGFPALLFLLLVLLVYGMRGSLNPAEAGIYLILGAPVCLLGGLAASVVAITRRDRPRWAAIAGLAINGILVVYMAISLLLSA
ncbi:hypothetical protein [Thermomonas sp. HDW16]|uniref:hypothetical protein n=1 Tax=Thermomonas sp. HDW16 TaxID=2714945 RepID=UPI00140C9BD2|nr:hypothetical protein [Thermomonas sp. HDW16]QIL21064.1 hypothetical protein G7079_10180 [Thermomonas sp. HDW16]